MSTNREIYRGRLISLSVSDLHLPNGAMATFDVITHPGASAVVAVDDDQNVVLVRVFRPIVGEFLYELPAGKLEPGDDPAVAAGRELKEETGAEAAEVALIAKMMTAPGYSTEVVHIYYATQLTFGATDLDDDEVLSVVRLPLAEALAMVYRGDIRDGKTIVGLLLAARRLEAKP